MTNVMDNPGGNADYMIELSATELEALREVAREADGRTNAAKTARRVLGVSY